MTDIPKDQDLRIVSPAKIELKATVSAEDLIKPAVGRPKIKLDTQMLEDLAAIFCTNKEIASIMNCSTDTLVRNYADHIKKGRDKGKSSLRRKQWEKAMEGNTTMLIWLGKQYLEQKDQPISNEENQPLPWKDE